MLEETTGIRSEVIEELAVWAEDKTLLGKVVTNAGLTSVELKVNEILINIDEIREELQKSTDIPMIEAIRGWFENPRTQISKETQRKMTTALKAKFKALHDNLKVLNSLLMEAVKNKKQPSRRVMLQDILEVMVCITSEVAQIIFIPLMIFAV